MKTKLITLTAALGICLSTFASIALAQAATTETLFSPRQAGITWDNYTTDGVAGSGDVYADASTGVRVGALKSGGANRLERGLLLWDLPAVIPDGYVIASAQLQLNLASINGTPSGPVSLYFSSTSRAFSGTNYNNNTDFTNTGITVATSGTVPGALSLDVTDLIKNAYDAGAFPTQVGGQSIVVATFRLQDDTLPVTGATAANMTQAYYRFIQSGTDGPKLLITYAAVPEPATWTVLAAAAGFVATLFARRKRRA
ncbi:hypothetical protein OPIT5_01930 [Opitutaceae bacterium TAV5]|nr:hypothetical protein OPIT5_01930 [Opitutaceae bacterium TAV5]